LLKFQPQGEGQPVAGWGTFFCTIWGENRRKKTLMNGAIRQRFYPLSLTLSNAEEIQNNLEKNFLAARYKRYVGIARKQTI